MAGKHVEDIMDIIYKEMCDVVCLPQYLADDFVKNKKVANKLACVQIAYLPGERIAVKRIAELKKIFSKEAKLCSYYGTTEAGIIAVSQVINLVDYEDGIIGKAIKIH